MKEIAAVGVDLSKEVFHIHAVNHQGRMIWRRRVQRDKFMETLSQLPDGCPIYMEACQSAHYWSRQLEAQGLRARQISPHFVKPFLKSQKNDHNDAQATVEAGSRPAMRFVPTKTVGQQGLEAMHRIRERLTRNRTALTNQMRGLLAEHGVAIPKGAVALRRYLAFELLMDNRLSESMRTLVDALRDEWNDEEKRISECEKLIRRRAKSCDAVRRLRTIPGIGLLTATALVAASGDPKEFKNGRQFAAWMGLVPRQVTTGGKPKLLGISKRGDTYLRTLLIHGGRVVVRHAVRRDDPKSLWIRKLHAAKGTNLTAVAVANKNARIAWRLLTSGGEYRAQLPHGAHAIQ